MRICLAPHEISGILLNLHKGLKNLGVDNRVYIFSSHIFGYGSLDDYDAQHMKKYIHLVERIEKGKNTRKSFSSFLNKIILTITRLGLFVDALIKCDCFFYLFGQGFFFGNSFLRKVEWLEFALLKFLKKRVIVEYCGSDSRPPYCDGFIDGVDAKDLKHIKQVSSRVKMVEKYATIVIDGPLSYHFHKKRYINYFTMWNPVDITQDDISLLDKKEKGDEDIIRILHSPSNLEGKGTYEIREIIKNLSSKYKINYIELTGVTHDTVIKELKKCDLVVDQLYCDTPLAVFATEACGFGKPVIVGGYSASYLNEKYANLMPPVCFCQPEKIKEAIEYYIVHREERKRLGQAGRDFIVKNNNYVKYAQKIVDLFLGRTSEFAWINPYEMEFPWGAGQNNERIRERLQFVYSNYGEKGFCIPDKSDVNKKFIDFISGKIKI